MLWCFLLLRSDCVQHCLCGLWDLTPVLQESHDVVLCFCVGVGDKIGVVGCCVGFDGSTHIRRDVLSWFGCCWRFAVVGGSWLFALSTR